MSEGLNKVILMGNLGSDPELRSTQSGQSLLEIRMATTEVYFDREKVKQERTEWHTVTVWGSARAEGLAKVLKKGDRILVEGRLHTESWEKDGEKRFRTGVVAESVILAGGGPRAADEPGQSGRYGESRHQPKQQRRDDFG
jgi:single-strand DNA-binding protein